MTTYSILDRANYERTDRPVIRRPCYRRPVSDIVATRTMDDAEHERAATRAGARRARIDGMAARRGQRRADAYL